MGRRHGLGRPDEQTADGMPTVQRIEKSPDLIPISDIAALKLGQGHVTAIDMIENR